LYGAGLRVMECLRLRVKDVDLGYRQILVRDGKGEKDRVTMMPEKPAAPLAAHLARVKSLHARDLEAGFGEVSLAFALARKYPHGAGAARAFGRVHDDDLHPRAQQGGARGEEPARPPRATARGVSVRGGGADDGLVVACLGYIGLVRHAPTRLSSCPPALVADA